MMEPVPIQSSQKVSRKRQRSGDSTSSLIKNRTEKLSRKGASKNKKTPTTRNLSSLKVFEEFVKYLPASDSNNEKIGENGSLNIACDASGILSKDCFDKWVETRTSKPKYPEESFRRAITAHIRGSDGRRPFKPIIEKALLVELRKKKIWPCFAHLENKIGVLGYQKLGYYESLDKTNGKDKSNAEELGNVHPEKAKKKRKEYQNNVQQSSITMSADTVLQSHHLKSIGPNHGVTLSRTSQQQQHAQVQLHGFINTLPVNQNMMGASARGVAHGHTTGNVNVPVVISCLPQNVGTHTSLGSDSSSSSSVSQKQFLLSMLQSQNSNNSMANMFRKYYNEEQLDQFLNTCENHGTSVINPSTFFMLNQQTHFSDPRLQESFLVPDPSTVSFDPKMPKGKILIDNTTLVCLRMDEVAKSLVGGDVTGYNAFVLCCSQLAVLKQMNIGFRNIQLRGETWMHIHLRRISDSTPVILLAHFKKVSDNLTEAVCQDVSEKKKYILDLPPAFI